MRRSPIAVGLVVATALAASVSSRVQAATPALRPAGTLTFGHNVTVYTGNYGEPGFAYAPNGKDVYTTTPGDGGAVLGISRDGGATWAHAPTVVPNTVPEGTVGTGGSDSDVVVAANGDVLTGDLQLGSVRAIVVSRSTDAGRTFPQQAAIPTGVADREWLAVEGPTGQDVTVSWHDLATGTILAVTSTDGGVTFTTPQIIESQITTIAQSAHNGTAIGQLVDDGAGNLYASYGTTRLDTTDTTYGSPPISDVHVSISHDRGTSWHDVTVNPGAADANYGNFWMSTAVDTAGNPYVVYSGYAHKGEPLHVWLQASKDKGETWTDPVVVDTGTGNALFGWVSGGGPDTATVVWYQTRAADKDADGISWSVEAAQVRGLLAGDASVYRGTVSDHVVHTGGICTLGTFCGILPGSSSDRSLLDFFKGETNPVTGMEGVSFSDNATGTGRVTFAAQTAGPDALEPITPAVKPGHPPKHGIKPVPVKHRPAVTTPSGGLAATGWSGGLTLLAVSLVCGAALARRRRT